MDLKAKLLAFLAHLPEVDGPDKRKALLTFTGFAHLGIYLDWQGSNVVFFTRLLEEFGRRGQAELVQFLDGLLAAPQVGVERQATVTQLRQEVEALSEEAWQAQFAVAAPVTVTKQPLDPAMLATSVVSTVLTPYFKVGREGLQDPRAAQLAEQLWEKVQAAFAGDAGMAGLLRVYKMSPEVAQAEIVRLLRDRLAADQTLAGELAELLKPTDSKDEAALRSIINVVQKAGTVNGTMIGTVFGRDAWPQGADVDVKQDLDTVGKDGVVVGVVAGGSGPTTVGGQHTHGDNVGGNKQEVHTGGGAFFGGNVRAGRDVVGRDQDVRGDEVHGDTVGGDKIHTGDISGTGIAIGRDAQAHVAQGVSGEELQRIFVPLMQVAASAPPDKRPEAVQKVASLQEEAAKGKNADDSLVAQLLDGLVGLLPNAASAVVSAFGTPLLSGIAGPVTKYVLQKMRNIQG